MHLRSAALRLAAAIALCLGLDAISRHAGALPAHAPLPEPFDVKAMDRRVNPCTDFFGYATGGYTATHPIPPAYVEYGYIEELVDRTREIVRDVIARAQRDPGPAGSDSRKIGTYYSACMDTPTIERRGLTPLALPLQRIAAIVAPADVVATIPLLQSIGVDVGFTLNANPDIYDSTKIIAEFDQGGIGLPERDYYLRADADSRTLRAHYLAHVSRMLQLSGDTAAASDARAIVALETQFARASTPAAALRDPQATYHPMSLRAAASLAPHWALSRFVRASGVQADRINVAEPAFVRAVDRALDQTPLATWRAYLRWRLLDAYAGALPARFEDENFAFRDRILNGEQTPLPRWKRCINATSTQLGEAVGRAYVAQTFSPDAKADALAMIRRIRDAFRAEMRATTWMTPATRRIAIAKLDAMGLKVGYPRRWRDYTAYRVRNDSYAANVLRGQTFERRYQLAKIGRPLDRSEWFMTPQTVNAYNDTSRNEIVLPAAQLQRPFYDPSGDDAANLGATGGGTVGHEMTHGFDDEGHKFDARGDLRNWWQPQDSRQFDARAQCVIEQFDRTVAVGTVHYQGRLVAGEAIADLGGVIIGLRALRMSNGTAAHLMRDGFTPEQRYFLSFAQSWTEAIRPEGARTEALTDPHPLPRDRVNQTVANIPAWYAAFNCAPPPHPVCTIW